MATTYGTIPTSDRPDPDSSSGVAFISRGKQRAREAFDTRRPWKELSNIHAFNIPHGFSDAYHRVQTNLSYFTMNYFIIALFVIFVSLLWEPISLIVFVVMIVAWLFLYFLRDNELVIFGRLISDKLILTLLSIITLVALLFTGVTWNIVSSVSIAVVIVLLHAVFRKTEDLCLDGGDPGISAGIPRWVS